MKYPLSVKSISISLRSMIKPAVACLRCLRVSSNIVSDQIQIFLISYFTFAPKVARSLAKSIFPSGPRRLFKSKPAGISIV